MECLLKRKIKGNRKTYVKEHLNRAKCIAVVIWARFQVGPYQYQLKHLIWYQQVHIQHLKLTTQYRHLLTLKNIARVLGKPDTWQRALQSSRY